VRGIRADGVRLLTLTGPGGVGKTRLAVEAAREMQAEFPDGAGFVSLAALGRHEDVAAAIVTALGIVVLSGETVYSAVDRKPKRTPALRRLANVRARPVATLLVDEYADDWSRLWWVRLRGPARVLEGGDERLAALVLLREKYPQYVRQPPDGAVLALDVAEWRGWAAVSTP